MSSLLLDVWESMLAGVGDFFSFIPQCLYFICASCLQVIDFTQLLFRKIIGLDTYSFNGTVAVNPVDFGDGSSGDLVLQILQKIFLNEDFSVLKTAFISMLILGSILLVITSITAILRMEYNPTKKPDGKKDWGKGGIVWSMIKAVVSFFAIPVICYFGIFIGNIALYGLDQATSPSNTNLSALDDSVVKNLRPSVSTGSTTSYDYYIFWGQISESKFTPMSGSAIRLSLYSANKVRLDDSFYQVLQEEDTAEGATINFGILNQYNDVEHTANAIDTLFMLNARLKTPQQINTAHQGNVLFKHKGTVEYFNRYDVGLVSYYYNLWYFNWPVAIAFILIAGRIFLNLIFGLIGRIYMVFGLLLVSPIAASMWPLDGGGAISGFRKKFVSTVAGAYSSIVAMNLFYLIYPVINSFSFLGTGGVFGAADYLFQLFFIIAGLLTIKKFDGMFAGFISGESIMDSGEKLAGDVMGTAAQTLGVATGAAKVGIGAAKLLASPISAGIGAGKNYADMRRARNKFEAAKSSESGQKAGISDKAIDSNTMDSIRGTQDYQSELDAAQQSISDSDYATYKGAGGGLSKQDWMDSTAEGSAFQASQEWESTVDKSKFKGQNGKFDIAAYNKAKTEFMRKKFDESKLASKDSYSHWLGVEKQRKKDLKNAKANGLTDEQRDALTQGYSANKTLSKAQEEVDERIQKALESGKGQSELERAAIKEQQAAKADREQARQELAAEEDKFRRQQRKFEESATYGQRFKRSALNGLGLMGSGTGSMSKIFHQEKKK